MTVERTNLIVKACYMYYIENMTQAEIAKRLGVSRPQVSRFLTYARENNIVSITINDPASNRNSLEEKMCSLFDLKECLIIDRVASNRQETMRIMGEESSDLIKRNTNDGDIIGVSAGKTLYYVSMTLQDPKKKNLRIVPVCGGTGYRGKEWQSNKIISNLDERWNCESYQLNSPTFVSSESLKDQLVKEHDIRNALELAKNCKLILVGIGLLKNRSTLLETEFLTEEDIQELKQKKAVSSICNSFLDQEGKEIPFSGYDRMIGYKIDAFDEATKIIAYAFGEEKTEAIISALRSKKIYALVTDILTAQSIIERYQ